jgi:type I restriction enzyme, S subunit
MAFEEISTPLFNQIEMLLRVMQSLSSTRDRLLSRLMSGVLDVEELDIAFPPSMEEEILAQGS